MKRIGIFVFYDFEGKWDKYIDFLLKSFENIIDKLIIVLNTNLSCEEKKRIEQSYGRVIERENYGFDAGAYKDALECLGKNYFKDYDQLILFNDTFYGPFYPWSEAFSVMDKRKVDFWGLTKVDGYIDANGLYDQERIQSYFLVFNSNIIRDGDFWKYWKDLEYPRTYMDDIYLFEIGIYQMLTAKGYRSEAYCKLFMEQSSIYNSFNPYGYHSYELIKECRCPVMRRKNLLLYNSINAKKAEDYIADNIDYDLEMIEENIYRYVINEKYDGLNSRLTTEFSNRHKNIYIYGNGIVSLHVKEALEAWNIQVCGNIVTKRKAEKDKNCIEIGDITFSPDDGVIIGVREEFCDEIERILSEKLDRTHILKMHYTK